jgi:hypothetical protein
VTSVSLCSVFQNSQLILARSESPEGIPAGDSDRVRIHWNSVTFHGAFLSSEHSCPFFQQYHKKDFFLYIIPIWYYITFIDRQIMLKYQKVAKLLEKRIQYGDYTVKDIPPETRTCSSDGCFAHHDPKSHSGSSRKEDSDSSA